MHFTTGTYTTILYNKPIPGYLPFLSFSLPSPCVPGKGFTNVSHAAGGWGVKHVRKVVMGGLLYMFLIHGQSPAIEEFRGQWEWKPSQEGTKTITMAL
jgi:hypothetical protein